MTQASPACPALRGNRMRPAFLFPVLLALFPQVAQAEVPGWWREGAVWAGDGVQTDGQRWSVEIVLEANGAAIRYPSIPCSGRLDLLSSDKRSIALRETITQGTQACISGGTVVLRVEAGGSLLFDWTDPDSGLKATAILAPPVS